MEIREIEEIWEIMEKLLEFPLYPYSPIPLYHYSL